MVPISLINGNLIGLPRPVAGEKRRIHASASHAHAAAAEVMSWPETSRMAGAADLPRDLPVAVVTAGPHRGREALKAIQEKAARHARRGHIEHVAPASHANLLGPRHADAVVRGVEFALQAGSR